MIARQAWLAAWTAIAVTLLTAFAIGGGDAEAAPVTPTPSGFGFHSLEASLSGTQAGSHPDLTIAFELNSALKPGEKEGVPYFALEPVGGEVRNLAVNLPPGVIGNPTDVARCTRQELDEEGACPGDTQVGVDNIGLGSGGVVLTEFKNTPVYNMVPPSGAPAQFSFAIEDVQAFIDFGVRSGGDYGITAHTDNITQRKIILNSITVWGVPADPSHDALRCEVIAGYKVCGVPSTAPLTPFLTLPTSCAGHGLTFTADASTWEEPNATAEASADVPAITGCGRLVHFNPSISAAPDTSEADTPTGLTVDVRSPQGLNPEGLATSDIEDTTVTLPEGLVINPGQAAGLVACQSAQEGLGSETDEGPPECPASSKVGTVEIETPLLKDTLKGDVYVLQSNPPNLQLLLAASVEGVNLKLVGNVHLDETTGRLMTTFDGNPPGYEGTPDLPFTELRLAFSGGAQAALATPTACGEYTTTSDFTPWSSPFIPDAFPTSSFAIDSGPDGSPCPSSPLPFSPQLIAGATTDQAGGFTDFSLLLQRGDDQQRIDGLQFKAPEGLTGFLSNVPLCTNAQAEANTCPAASKIGHTVVESGPGPYPLVVPEPGQEPAPIYLTESYDGAPFGLSVVVPLHVGPFVLPTQRVRAKIGVNPITSALTVTTNPLPQVVAGIQTDLHEVDAVIERPEFMVNPTNCDPQEFSGTAYGTSPPGSSGPGAGASISTHFQVGACRALDFAPKFSVATSGKTSKADGASLTTKVSYPNVPQGTDADIGSVKVELPKQLPSRLTTLQKACLAKVFEANPATCPAASFIGHAVVRTPLLPVPLAGPAIFVAHGGEAFPSLTMVLQGDGVTIDLVGTTFISKAGITSTTFKTVPDDPFNTFELTFAQGPYSALAANVPAKAKYSLCGQKLVMPNEFVGQNGAAIRQDTTIDVTGCGKAKSRTRAQKLAAALRACRMKVKGKRAGCERRARKQYASARAGAKKEHNKQH